jgi:hypothetical protein
MTHDPTRDCEHGRLKGKCDVCDLQAEAEVDKTIIEYHEATIERLNKALAAQPAPNCTRSHPHENMDAMCELRTKIARLTNENARLKEAQPAPVQEPVATLFGSLPVYDTTPPAAQPDYAWPTIADYEKEVGFEVNDAFKAAWTMARTTNDLFKQMGENT